MNISDQLADERNVSQKERNNHKSIFDNVAVGMHWVNAEGIIIWANQTEMDLLGYSPDEYIGHHISEFHSDKNVIDDILIRLSRKETLNLYEARIRCKDGTVRNVIINSNVLWEGDKFIHTRCFTLDVTEQKHAQEKLAESESKYKQFIKGLPAAFYSCNADGFIELYNESAVNLWGRVPQIGKDLWCGSWKIYKNDGSPLPLDECPMAIALKEGRSVSFEIVIERPDGSRRNVLPHPKPVYDANGKITGAINTLIDITEQVNARKKVEESEKRFKAMADNIPNLAWMANADGWIYWYNKKWYDYTGTTPEQMEGWGWQSVHDPQKLQSVIDRWKKSLASAEPFDMVFPLKGADGKYRQFLTRVLPLRNEEGNVIQWFGTNTDITQQIEIEQALKESEERFRTMAEASDILIAVGDDTSNAVYFNKAWVRLTGRPMEDLLKFGWVDLVHPEDKERYVNGYLAAYEKRVGFTDEFRVLSKDGEYRWLLAQVPPLFRPDGSFAGYISSCMDITELKNAIRKIQDNEQDLRSMVLESPVGICLLDASTRIIEIVNESFIEIAGKPREAIVGKFYWDTFAEARDYYEQALTDVVEKGITYFASEVGLMLIRHGKEEFIYVTFVYAPLKDSQGKVKKVAVWVLENTKQVTERQKVEELVAERTKELTQVNNSLEKINKELQSFAYISSHDMQEPLRKIQTFATQIMEKEFLHLSDSGKDKFIRMQSAAERMQTLIEDLLAYSRTNTAERKFEKTSLSDIIEEVKEDLIEEIQRKNATVQNLSTDVINVIPFQFRQLLFNLISNSLKFSDEKQVPCIKIKSEMISGEKLNNQKLDNEKNYYRITVSDNGIGFEQEFCEKIFEVFQRLHGKDKYAGTGIGLAIVKKIVENHNGVVLATGELNKGATFDIYIPVT